MKTIALIFLIFMVSTTAQSQVVEWLDGREVDLGDIPQGKPKEAIFKFRNISNEPIVVEIVNATCGCTIPEWSQVPVAPGAIDSIRVVYDAQKSGWFQKKIRVFFVDVRRVKKLTIYGEVSE